MIFSAGSAAALNLQVVAPECAVRWTYLQKWIITQSLPLLFAVVFGALVALSALQQAVKSGGGLPCRASAPAVRRRIVSRLSPWDSAMYVPGPGAALRESPP
jgi:hypothetical protein